MSQELIDALINMKEEEAVVIATDLLDGGEDPLNIMNFCNKAMDIIGKRYETGEYFLPNLILAGEMLRQISEIVKPRLKSEMDTKRLGKVIIGTVAGDIHDLGKDIVVLMLDVSGFEVLDLGVDVPIEKFVGAVNDFQPQVVGLSGFLTLAFDSMKETINAMSEARNRDKIKIMIGGGQIDDEVLVYTGADAYGNDAMDAVRLCKQWIVGN